MRVLKLDPGRSGATGERGWIEVIEKKLSPRPSASQEMEIVRLYLDGVSTRGIAQLLGVSRDPVIRRVKQLPRPQRNDPARRPTAPPARTPRGVRLRVMTDHSMAFSEQIRRAAGIGIEPPQTEEQKPEPPADPDFGAGARQATPTEVDMNTLIRASFYGEWRRP
jgi:hypothetical protein